MITVNTSKKNKFLIFLTWLNILHIIVKDVIIPKNPHIIKRLFFRLLIDKELFNHNCLHILLLEKQVTSFTFCILEFRPINLSNYAILFFFFFWLHEVKLFFSSMVHTKPLEHIAHYQKEFELNPGTPLFPLNINLNYSLYGSSRETSRCVTFSSSYFLPSAALALSVAGPVPSSVLIFHPTFICINCFTKLTLIIIPYYIY